MSEQQMAKYLNKNHRNSHIFVSIALTYTTQLLVFFFKSIVFHPPVMKSKTDNVVDNREKHEADTLFR